MATGTVTVDIATVDIATVDIATAAVADAANGHPGHSRWRVQGPKAWRFRI